MTRHAAAAAALAAAAGLAPAAGHADAAEWHGQPCAYTATHEPSGLADPNPDHVYFVIDGGAGAAADVLGSEGTFTEHPGPARITQYCSIQLDDSRAAVEGFTARAAAYCEFGSPVVGPADRTAVSPHQACVRVVEMTSRHTPYLCTWWRVEHAGGVEDWLLDSDQLPGGSSRVVPAGSPALCAPPW